jgi:hypothetical protein
MISLWLRESRAASRAAFFLDEKGGLNNWGNYKLNRTQNGTVISTVFFV